MFALILIALSFALLLLAFWLWHSSLSARIATIEQDADNLWAYVFPASAPAAKPASQPKAANTQVKS